MQQRASSSASVGIVSVTLPLVFAFESVCPIDDTLVARYRIDSVTQRKTSPLATAFRDGRNFWAVDLNNHHRLNSFKKLKQFFVDADSILFKNLRQR